MPHAEPATLVVSIVSGSDAGLLLRCVETVRSSLLSADIPECIVVVRNGDGAPSRVELERVGATHIIDRERPLGFAANHNDVMTRFPARYHLLANDDVRVPLETIPALVRFLELPGNQRVGAVSPRLLNFDGTLQPSTYSFPTVPRLLVGVAGLRDYLGTGRVASIVTRLVAPGAGRSRMWPHDQCVDVDTFRGAFVVVRGHTVADVGLMDEVSLVGGEETEWHRRMAHSGWRVVFWPGASVFHKGSATVGGRGDLEVEYLKGALNYFDKHRSVPAAWLAHFGSAGVLTGRWLGAALRGDRKRRGELARSIRFATGTRRSRI